MPTDQCRSPSHLFPIPHSPPQLTGGGAAQVFADGHEGPAAAAGGAPRQSQVADVDLQTLHGRHVRQLLQLVLGLVAVRGEVHQDDFRATADGPRQPERQLGWRWGSQPEQ